MSDGRIKSLDETEYELARLSRYCGEGGVLGTWVRTLRARNQICGVLYVNLTRVGSCDTIGYRLLSTSSGGLGARI